MKYFYDSIGYENRVIDIKEISAEGIVEKAAQILEHNEGVEKDREKGLLLVREAAGQGYRPAKFALRFRLSG